MSAKSSKPKAGTKTAKGFKVPSIKDQARAITDQALYSDKQFLARDIPKRTWIVEGCIPHPSIGLLYAWRGSGKTYTALRLAIDIAKGHDFMVYPVPRKRTVLYIDGEMPVSDLQERVRVLSDGHPTDRLWLVSSEDLAQNHIGLNLAEENGRLLVNQLLTHLERRYQKPALVILDNWVSLIRGLDENDNAGLDEVKEWLMRLRHGGVSVLFIHHAGKEGQQRGASGREDIPDYSITLAEKAGVEGDPTTHIVFEWDKVRGVKPEPRKFRMELGEDENGQLQLRPAEDAARGEPPVWLEYLKWWAENGQPTDREGAAMRDLSRSAVEKNMRTARSEGLLLGSQGSTKGRRLTEKGVERIKQYWPKFEIYGN